MGFLIDLKNSIFSVAAYRDLAFRPVRRTIWYLIIIALVTGIPASLNTQRGISNNLNDLVVNSKVTIGAQSPEKICIALVGGEMALAGEIPGGYDSLPVILVGTIGLDLFQVDHIDLRASDLQKFAPHLKKIAVAIFAFSLIGFALGKFFMAVAMTLVCLAFAQIKKARMDFIRCFNVTCYAFTFPLIIQAVQVQFFPGFAHPDLIFFGTLMIYQYLAVATADRIPEIAA